MCGISDDKTYLGGLLQRLERGRVAVRFQLRHLAVESSVQRALVLEVSDGTGLKVIDVDRGGRAERHDRHSSVVLVDGELRQNVLHIE